MADNKLPARQTKLPLEPSSGGSIFGRIKSAFRSRLNTGTIINNTIEAEAHRLYMQELERLAEAIERKERAVRKLVDDLPGLFKNDRAEHRLQMKLDRLARIRKFREAKRADELAALEHKAKITDAKFKSDRTQWGHDAFKKSLPHREERIDHLFKTGTLDAEIEMLMRDRDLTKLMPPKRSNRLLPSSIRRLSLPIEIRRTTMSSPRFMDSVRG